VYVPPLSETSENLKEKMRNAVRDVNHAMPGSSRKEINCRFDVPQMGLMMNCTVH
jgi:hypothetical protein